MTRVPDLASQNLTLSYMRETQARMLEAQLQVSTGKAAQRYTGIARESARLVNLEADHVRTTQFVANNKIIDQRLQKMETNVAAVFELTSRFRTLLVNASSGGNIIDVALVQNADAMLQEMAGLLNEQANGRYLFAGSQTDTAPVDLAGLPPDGNFTGTADADYYQGDDRRLSIRVAEAVEVTYGVTADEAGFERVIRALQIARTTDVSAPDTAGARLDEALQLVNEAIQEIPDIRSRIGSARSTIEATNTRHDEFLLYAEKAIGDIENVDVTEAFTRLSADQATLEASFAAMARLSSLSLIDYLR